MNIGLITPYFPDQKTVNSGLANHFDTLAHALAARGNKVVVIHIRPAYENEPAMDHRSQGSITIVTISVSLSATLNNQLRNRWALADAALKFKAMQVTLRQLPGIIKKHHLEVIETTSFLSLTYLFTFLKKPPIPIALRVSTTYTQMLTEYYPFQSRALRFFSHLEIKLIKRSKHLLTHTQNHALEIEKLYGIEATRFAIIPHGIKLPYAAVTLPEEHVIKVLFVGRMEYRKGIDVLLKAIPMVLGKQADIVFQLIGEDANGKLEKDFRQTQPPVINKQVTFLGVTNAAETQAAYAACDLFVAPSRYESFGLIYIEAMSFGKPAIGCNAGGTPEVIDDGKTGLLAEPGNADDLAACILKLAGDKQLRLQMGINAGHSARQNFTAEILAERSEQLYRKLIKEY